MKQKGKEWNSLLLKAVDIQGFKSFPDKTHLSFHSGFTAVVGPNGSGKSNISDAIRWVLGEQSSKALRGSKMEDVIFIGSKTRKAQGYAQVSLTFDNHDHTFDFDQDELVVSRKFYRSGESEYLLNGKAALHKDIAALFMDTGLGKDGYSIIGQGKIDEIVSAKSSDRRQIFEEAAGIAKFRYRKKEAIKRLSASEENLVRLRDILDELEARIGPLKEQQEKAKMFKELDGQREDLEVSIWLDELEKLQEQLRVQEDKWLIATQDYQTIEDEILRYSGQSEKLQQEVLSFQMKTEQLRMDKESALNDASSMKSDIAVLKNDIEHIQRDIQRIQEELLGTDLSRERLEKEAQESERVLEELAEQISQDSEQMNGLEHVFRSQEQGQEKVATLLLEAEKKVQQSRIDLSALQMNLQGFQTRLMEREEQAAVRLKEQQTAEDKLLYLQKELDEVQLLLQILEEKEASLSNEQAGFDLKLAQKQKRLSELEQNIGDLSRRIDAAKERVKILQELDRNMEGFAYSVKQILQKKQEGFLKGIHGTIASLIQTPGEYTMAIETALGGALQNIVTTDEDAAKRAIYFLKDKKAGRATFLPITAIRSNQLHLKGLEQMSGFVGIASNLVTTDSAYRAILENLLGRTVVAEDLNAASAIAKQYKYQCKIVTLDGQLIHAGGSMTGGSQSKSVRFLSRKNELEQLEKSILSAGKEQLALEKKRSAFIEEIEKISAQQKGIENEAQLALQDRIRAEGEQQRLQNLLTQFHQAVENTKRELQQEREKKQALQQEQVHTQRKLEDLKQALAVGQEEQEKLSNQLSSIQADKQETEHVLNDLKIKIAEQNRDLESKRELVQTLHMRLQGDSDHLKALQMEKQEKEQQIEQSQLKITQTQEEIQKLLENEKTISHSIELALESKRVAEKKANELFSLEKESLVKKEGVSKEIARLEERKASLEKDFSSLHNRLWESYHLTVPQAKEMAKSIEDMARAKQELQVLRSKIKALGNVNLGAIEEYKEVSERYHFLHGQVTDAEHAKRELEKLIDELTTTMQSMFEETFHKINQTFQTTFVELFGGGSANLILEDPSNVLESGIQIQVQPPGKIVKNLSALSGGEKAFIAIAIYFSILKIRPAPFCILDEIEAALDDVNVNKFASYLKTLGNKTQFIVITHRRGTMEEANVLYGVTMQEEGVSKLIELRVQELMEQQIELKGA